MTFLTSYRRRSIGASERVLWAGSNDVTSTMSISTRAGRTPPATSIGTGRPIPMNTSSFVGLTSAVTIPTTRPLR